ncbi:MULTISPECIES: DUF3696 domain-containing protein [Bacillus]|uniref:AAA family ATPase n=1 Tax=Bacillus TaxID=1386 RepID=UPI000BFD88DF|nr:MULTISPECIES: DUF3696 domain-containing protein [Bacillus]MCR6850065.1 DUF3696 domain-containing protein [Bacillus sp. IBL03825]PGK38696.1 hypothetical protein CN908_17180 [Bacillus thuringiensis]
MLDKLVIHNFKCFQRNEISFKPLTILVGGNGVGKSSVIQSLLISKQSLNKLEPNQVNEGLEFEIELTGPYLLNLGFPKNILSSNADSKQISFSLINDLKQEIKLDFTFPEIYGEHLLQGKVVKVENHLNIPLQKDFSYLNAERLGPRVGLPLGTNSEWNVGYKGEYSSHILFRADNSNMKVHELLKVEGDSSRFSRQAEAWLQAIVPGLQLDYKIIDDVSLASLKFKSTSLDTDFLPAPNTGFGISYTLPIIVAGLIQSIQGSGTLIVENPEAHLHPLGQSRIGRFLARVSMTGVQVIVETHSEHVINGARIEMAKLEKSEDMKVNFFNTKNNNINIEELHINKVGELSDWPNGFFDQEQYDLKELFNMKRISNKK